MITLNKLYGNFKTVITFEKTMDFLLKNQSCLWRIEKTGFYKKKYFEFDKPRLNLSMVDKSNLHILPSILGNMWLITSQRAFQSKSTLKVFNIIQQSFRFKNIKFTYWIKIKGRPYS